MIALATFIPSSQCQGCIGKTPLVLGRRGRVARYPDSSAAYRYNRSTIQCLPVTIYHFNHQCNTLLRWYVWQSNQSCMGNVMQIDQLSEIRVYCNQDPGCRFREFQQGPVSRVRTKS